MSGVVVQYRMPWLVRLIGGRDRYGRRSWRMRWGELSIAKAGLAMALCSFEDHFSLHVQLLWLNAYLQLPFLQRWHREPPEMMQSWGLSTLDGAIHLNWGRRYKILTLPWRDWVRIAHDVRLPDGSWAPFVGSWEKKGEELRDAEGRAAFEGKEPDGRHIERLAYRYVLRSGVVQFAMAEVYVERWTWKLRWLQWLPFARVRHGIEVSFSKELGEQVGSWKGGVLGCSYALRPNETPEECLRRMERDRRFD